ncbi:hypothetical protein L1987_11017 [Smallanthus sonchifolius]|uniref:Uncharacterized protein n=1 Tax=Smallanthus sonchifolius TaxID=185202 RepID=A0ACB9JBA6_9ASTR|nr:hypothetical protein L1987_11017 [Smallanthus sonchifolius]
MPITRKSITAVPKTFYELQVLLVEPNKKSLQHHAYVLFQNSYRVTRHGYGKSIYIDNENIRSIINGNTFDGVLLDAENRDMDLVDFLYTIWNHQPQLRIIVMTSNESHMQLARESLVNDVIWFLRKPCGVSNICNLLQHVCRKRFASGEGTSTGKTVKENHRRNIVQKVDTMRPSTIFNITMINNNRSSSNDIHQLDINSQKYGSMCKPVAYVDISSDEDEATTNKNICTGRAQNKYKGKQPVELKRKNEQWAEDGINRQKRKDTNTRIAWTPALHGKFLEALISPGKEGASPKAILNHMNVPGLTRAQVASHLQRIQERENCSMKPWVVGPMQKGINLQVESYACKRSGLLTPCDNNASKLNCSSLQRVLNYNSTGISSMSLDKIRANLQGVPQLPLPQQTTTTINHNSAADQSIEHHFGVQFQPLIGETSMSTAFGLVDQANEHNFGDQFEPLIGETSKSSDFVLTENTHCASGQGSRVIYYGNIVEPVVTGENTSHHTGEAMAPLGVSATVESQSNLQTDAGIFSNGFDNANFVGAGGSAASEGLAPFDRFGIPIESSVTVGGVVEASLDIGFDDMTFPELISHDVGGVENNSEAQIQSPGNSIIPMDGSEGATMALKLVILHAGSIGTAILAIELG